MMEAVADRAPAPLFPSRSTPWEKRLRFVLDMMREMSQQTDPQTMVQMYGARMRQVMPLDGSISLSRRNLAAPLYRITRSSTWSPKVNPWKHSNDLPVFDRGLLGRLLYGDD